MARPSRVSPLRILAIKRNPTGLLKLLWLIALLTGEILVFHAATWPCPWPEHTSWRSIAPHTQPYHIALVADPQITDQYSYGYSGVLEYLLEFYTDLYMSKNWRRLNRALRPDAIFFLGDLMDGGREWSEETRWVAEYKRFMSLFRPLYPETTSIYYMAGNHDIGFGEGVRGGVLERFKQYFNTRTSYEVSLGNHSFVILDTVSLSSHSQEVFAPVAEFLALVPLPAPGQPRILLTHVPLHRSPSDSCGPLRGSKGTITQGIGPQYQNLVTAELTRKILETIRPQRVFSGDDHDYCEHVHHAIIESAAPWLPRTVVQATEITVNTFSMAQGVRRPGYLLLSLFNPDIFVQSDPAQDTTGEREAPPTSLVTLCLMPDQLGIYGAYAGLAALTLLALPIAAVARFRNGWYRALANREEFEMPVFVGRAGDGYESEEEGRARVRAGAGGMPGGGLMALVQRREFWKGVAREVGEVVGFGVIVYAVCLVWALVT
ncbi:Metallo-dependent phosphatase-like protein [Endogone sp. FLAS-F59071]|nr:Metallo-dependent phosphatase-like protein [Endogone sp. FLAS-F59071]|eukprot:RUS22437.1 Metallo-dependent phosphatase-like protein [Endogone sp. FLAS-F59071]